MDRILIRDLRLRTVLGVHAWERAQPREVLVNLELETDLAAAADSDDLADAVDYHAVAEAVTTHVEGAAYPLLERLAQSIAEMTLERYPKIVAITVEVDKPGALRLARSVAVKLRRAR